MPNYIQLCWTNESIRILGIEKDINPFVQYEKNYRGMIEKIKGIL